MNKKITIPRAGLALATNAMLVFKHLGIMEKVIEKGKLISHLSILDPKGELITKTASDTLSKKYGLGNYAIHRADFHSVLLSEIDKKTLFLIQG